MTDHSLEACTKAASNCWRVSDCLLLCQVDILSYPKRVPLDAKLVEKEQHNNLLMSFCAK